MTNLSPLQPVKRKNLKEYREFRSAVRSLVSEYTEQISEIKKANQRYQVQNSETLQIVYSHGLELLLVEATQEEKRLTPFQKLTEAVGVAPDDSAWIGAIGRHVTKTDNLPENAEIILSRVTTDSGLSYNNLNQIRDEVAYLLLNTKHEASKLGYLVRLLGDGEFSERTKDRARTIAIGCLGDANFQTYDTVMRVISDIAITDMQRKLLSDTAMRWAEAEKFDQVKSLEQRVPSCFTETDVMKLGVNFLRNFKFEQYKKLCEEFKVGEFDDTQKQRIRDGVIEHLKQNPGDYSRVSRINELAKMSVTATPDELKQVVDSYFKRAWNRTNPQEVAKTLNQQLDTSQVNQRYVELIKRFLEDDNGRFNGESYANDRWRNRDEAQELFRNLKIPVSSESVQDVIRFTKHSERLVYISNFMRVGYSPTTEDAKWFRESGYHHDDWKFFESAIDTLKITPTNDDLEILVTHPNKYPKEKIRWIERFKQKYNYSPSQAVSDDIFTKLMRDNPDYSDVESAIRVVGPLPESYIERIVRDSLGRHQCGLSGISTSWDSRDSRLDRLMGNLRERNLVHLTADQIEQVYSVIRSRNSIEDLTQDMKRTEYIYGIKPSFSENAQRKVLSMIDREVGNQAYTNVKHNSTTFWNNAKKISGILSNELREEARDRVSQLVAKGDTIYQGFYYAMLTGAKPQLTPEVYQTVMTQFKSYEKRFTRMEYDHFSKMLESWKPQTGGRN